MKRYKFNVEITLDTDEELNNDFIEGLTELLNDEVGDICKVSVKEDLKWQKLKEWLNDRMEHYNDCLDENAIISSEREEVLCARYNQCFETIAQMEYIEKELEGEDESL